ncbi:hypothetical protein [Microvirga thermotolerans]|uniref:Uncharacterized protein n=1 Tax=Microvirga thermotolerans TaxID=2651334 RepID=A0A5P9JWV0_9HYPH|nr:hypothetical protein [Microvirga thermotolerans]QFU16709.1 hypothetical protein GDR74_10980 [Microvirga thermotolerans]
MTDDEVETVAAELAKAGGHSWYPGRERGPFKVVADRYRDRARLAIAALDRLRASRHAFAAIGDASGEAEALSSVTGELRPSIDGAGLTVGDSVLYRPPGDQRFYQCRVEKIEQGRAYLVPDIKICTGWVDIKNLVPVTEEAKRDA